MSQTLSRTGIVAPSADNSDPFDPVTYIRNNANWAESLGAMYAQGLLSARPTAGKVGRFYRATDDTTGVIYYDDGSTWQTIGAGAATDAAANVGSLRTLGAGALQAAAGNHTHAIGAITGTGDSVTKSVGTTAGTVAAGNHTHSGTVTTQVVTKASTTPHYAADGTTPLNDPELALTLAAGTYRVAAYISASGAAASDILTAWTFSGTATTAIRGTVGPVTTTTAAFSTSMSAYAVTLTGQVAYGVDGSSSSYIREDLILTVTGSGTLTFQWCVNSTGGTGTFVNAGSTLVADRVA